MNETSTDRNTGLLHRITGQFRLHPAAAPPPKYQPVGPSIHAKPAPPPPEPVAEVALKLDERSKALLVALGQGPASTFGFGNAELAAELLRCECSVPANSKEAEHNRAVVQRLAMVSRMIASIDADPDLPEGFKQSFDRLRFTLIKSALADVTFLTQPRHPLRAIASELANRAAEAGPNDTLEEKRLDESLTAAINDFDLSASFVKPIVQRLRPLDLAVIRQFWAQIEESREERATRRRARSIVTAAIQSRTKGLALPAELEFVVNHEWAAVMTWRLVQGGTASEGWRDALRWLEQVLSLSRTLEPRQGLPKELMDRLKAGLLDAGRSVGPAVEALEAMTTVQAAKPQRPVTLTDTAQVALPPLGRLLYTARWFRVFDHQQQKVRWLQATRYDAPGNIVEFAEIDGCNTLRMSCQQFVEDLRAGLSVPNTPDDETRALLAELQAASA